MSASIINGTKVTMGVGENCLFFRTFSRQHSRSNRFLVARKTLSDWLEGDKSEQYNSDLGNFLRLQKRGENLHMPFTWLSGSDERLSGHNEYVIIPISLVQNLLSCEFDEIQYLHANRTKPSRVDFSSAGRTLIDCIADKLARRALSKALRDRYWRDSTITMYERGFTRYNAGSQALFKVVGVSDLAIWQAKQAVFDEIPPTTVKKLLTGNGMASKDDVAEALARYVGPFQYASDDQSDAVAVGVAWVLRNDWTREFH